MDKFDKILDEILSEWKTPKNKLSSETLFSNLEIQKRDRAHNSGSQKVSHKGLFGNPSYWKWALSIAACLIIALGLYIHQGGFYPLDKEGMIYNDNTQNKTMIQECNLSNLNDSGIMDGTQSDIICYALLMDVPNEK
ncbi:MAG: hypothetical protein IJS60_08245 [Abditibacteriota bacterium]|nr:hypothetical protein [Abditibacteriota bacterium]